MTGKYQIIFAVWFMTVVNYMERVVMEIGRAHV